MADAATRTARRLLAVLLPVMALGAALAVLAGRYVHPASGPETELVLQLKRAERLGLELELGLPGGEIPLRSHRVRFDRISVQADPSSGSAEVAVTLDFDGTLGATRVSSLGVERIAFVQRDGAWVPRDGLAPRLAAAVRALEARRQALERGDRQRLATLAGQGDGGPGEPARLEQVLQVRSRRYAAQAWFLRLERDGAVVSEEFRLTGSLPERPVDERGTTRLTLWRDEREFFFSAPLM